MINEIRASSDKLSALIETAKTELSPEQAKSSSMTYEYLCVAICGRIEQDVKTILVEYARRSSERKLERVVARVCREFMNPEKDKILKTLDLFDRDLAKKLTNEWKDENSIGNTINELVGHRKRIAHQTNSNLSMTRSHIEKYFYAYKSLIKQLDEHFLKN